MFVDLYAFDRNRRQSGEAECVRCCRCYVDNASTDKGPAIIDCDYNRVAVAAIGNSNL